MGRVARKAVQPGVRRAVRKAVQPARRDLPTRTFRSPAAFEAWLAEHHANAPGVWVKFAKKGSGVASVTYPEALEVALCHGWIDGQVRRLDERYYLQRFTPRARRSKWSKINCAKAEALTAAGRMKPAGLRQVEAAKSDGRWGFAYDSPRNATAHPDLLAALGKNRAAEKFFSTLGGAEPVRDPVPGAKREEAGDPRQAHREAGRDARRGAEAVPVAGRVSRYLTS